MLQQKIISVKRILLLISSLYFISCSKESASTPATVTDPCTGKTITVTTTPTAASPCGGPAGSIVASATGSNGFTYKLNSGGAYQASGTFNNVSAGSYTVFAKDAGGCEKSTAVTVAASGTAGPFFTAVKNLMSVTCQSCHNNTVQNGSMNWQVDCNIVQFKARIKVKAVDEGTMPQGGPELSATQKAIITNWINAGGTYAD